MGPGTTTVAVAGEPPTKASSGLHPALVGVGVGAVGFTAFLTAAYTGMRDVMRSSGGFCANGGAYVIAHHCTSGQVRLVTFGILGLVLFGIVYAGFTARADAPLLGGSLLLWAALFGALGWNFIDLGANPPQGQGATSGWMVSGVVFWLMAAGGLIPALVLAVAWLRRGRESEPEPPLFPAPLVRAAVHASVPLSPVALQASPTVAAQRVARAIWAAVSLVGGAAGVALGVALADALK